MSAQYYERLAAAQELEIRNLELKFASMCYESRTTGRVIAQSELVEFYANHRDLTGKRLDSFFQQNLLGSTVY